jgi:hypothetical protein
MCRKNTSSLISWYRICSTQEADGTCHVLCHPIRLFFSDVKGGIPHVMVNTVDKNKSKYTLRQYSGSKARLIHDIIGRPSMVDYAKYVENNLKLNCPIIKEEIVHAADIIGPSSASLKGKTTLKSPERE